MAIRTIDIGPKLFHRIDWIICSIHLFIVDVHLWWIWIARMKT